MEIPVQRGDAALVAAIAGGDRAALAELYDRYASMLMAVAMQRLQNRGEAEEVLHDVFTEAWRHAGEYDPSRGTVRAWLVTRMHSRALDRRRSAAWRTRAPLEPAQLERIGYSADPAVEVDGARVRAALAGLPAEQRQVIELAYLQGLSASEIAARIDLPIGTVKSRTASAFAKLRGELLGGRG